MAAEVTYVNYVSKGADHQLRILFLRGRYIHTQSLFTNVETR